MEFGCAHICRTERPHFTAEEENRPKQSAVKRMFPGLCNSSGVPWVGALTGEFRGILTSLDGAIRRTANQRICAGQAAGKQPSEDHAAHRPFAAAHAMPSPGEMAVFRSPSADGFDLLTSFGSRARIGALVADLYPGPVSRFDLGNALVVDLASGTLESVTDLSLFGRANALAVETAPGTWEIVQAGSAELIAPGRYRLTRLLRGQRGTEGAMGNPAPAGSRVVVLDNAITSLPTAEADIGLPWNWRIGPANRSVGDETYVAQAFAPAGAGLRPFSVAHVEQPWRRPRTPGDLTIRWKRRARALSADSWGAVEGPLIEESETNEVEILEGVAVNRTLTTSATSVIYTAAQQTTDWGALLGPGDSATVRIFQLSALVGHGAAKTVTLKF